MTELPELVARGGFFTVEASGGGTYEVVYDEEVSHDHSTLVDASVRSLRALAGVDGADREDREVVLVVAPQLSAGQLHGALARFWRVAAASPPRADALQSTATALEPALSAAGFGRRGLSWSRQTAPGVVQVLELARHRSGEEERTFLWVAVRDREAAELRFESSWPAEDHCQLRTSTVALAGGSPGGQWAPDGDPAAVVAFVAEVVLAFLDARRTRAALVGDSEVRPVDRAVLAVLEGDPAAALDLLQQEFDRWVKARDHVVTVAGRLGLEVRTGADPAWSRAEEEMLATWIATEDASVDEFRRSVAAAGGPPADRLDGSISSLVLLVPWFDGAIREGRVHPGGPRPSLLEGLATGVWQDLPASFRPLFGETKWVAEGTAAYLGAVLREQSPEARWALGEGAYGVEPVLAGVPAGPAHVVKATLDMGLQATRRREGLVIPPEYHPLLGYVDRWLGRR